MDTNFCIRRLSYCHVVAVVFLQFFSRDSLSQCVPGTTIGFYYTGSIQNWTMPAGFYNNEVAFQIYGAAGSYGCSGSSSSCGGGYTTPFSGGGGGIITATLTIAAGTTIYIFVGGQGSTTSNSHITNTDGDAFYAVLGGFNGTFSTASCYPSLLIPLFLF